MRAAINLALQTLTYRSYIRTALCFQKLGSRIGDYPLRQNGCWLQARCISSECALYSLLQSERTTREANLSACQFQPSLTKCRRILQYLPVFCRLERLTQKRDKESSERRDEALARFTADPSRECARSLAAFRTRVVSLARACATRPRRSMPLSFVRSHTRTVESRGDSASSSPRRASVPAAARSLVSPRPARRKRDEFLRSDSYPEPCRGTLAILIPACGAPANQYTVKSPTRALPHACSILWHCWSLCECTLFWCTG